MIRLLVVLFATACLGGCAMVKATPPQAHGGKSDYDVVLDADYNKVWSALVDYSSQTFFAIENIEKESGLMTLSFGSGDEARFIDCGNVSGMGGTNTTINFIRSTSQASLNGKMNVLVKEEAEGKTRLRVNARYIYQAADPSGVYTWSFDTGGSFTVSSPQNSVTCLPTHNAERDIINGVKARLSQS